MEKKYEETLLKEEERVSYQRKLLLLYQKKIRERENLMLIEAKNSMLRKRALARENELEMLLKNLEKEVCPIALHHLLELYCTCTLKTIKCFIVFPNMYMCC